jgi:predicted DNA-binding transcriptional regulator YafY
MKGQSPKISPETWKKLVLLGEKQGTIKLKDLSIELGLTPEDTLVFIRQVFPGGLGAQVYHQGDEYLVDLDASSLQYMLPLSPAEWIQLHQLLSSTKASEFTKNTGLASLRNKLNESGPIKVVMELLSQLQEWDLELSETQQELVRELDMAVEHKKLVKIESKGKSYNVFPAKVLHLEGKLSLIAEESQDHCLVVISIAELSKLTLIETSSQPKVAAFEVEEFIAAIRAMNEKETRLILKIHDPQSVNLFPDHHFLGKPCMVTNPAGDLIWAAYVEPCDDLFEWLITLGNNVEILDPLRFREDFLSYCGEKVRKIA